MLVNGGTGSSGIDTIPPQDSVEEPYQETVRTSSTQLASTNVVVDNLVPNGAEEQGSRPSPWSRQSMICIFPKRNQSEMRGRITNGMETGNVASLTVGSNSPIFINIDDCCIQIWPRPVPLVGSDSVRPRVVVSAPSHRVDVVP
ncbi:hypothetical protein FOZ61_009079 [Perkinsus olseni]|uniref:Uncharacterized protein n=1 Tax=Perkinsus olseni TaxID=32597 RepID=A0A7J6L3D1_PEROL|nr:hypothetical protein FOZ61_009079 [Perkinsus olseni]KAF4655542.1 hypothetical protein FOL46_008206 [Perkinsus olseni]